MKLAKLLFFLGIAGLAFYLFSPTFALHMSFRSYGTTRFTGEVLSFRSTGRLPASIQEKFHPISTALRYQGVMLVYKESPESIEGIYVDPTNLDVLANSHTERMDTWATNVAWLKERKFDLTPEAVTKAKATIDNARSFRSPNGKRPEIPEE